MTQDLERRGVKYAYEPDCLKYDFPVRGGVCKKCGAAGVTRSAHYTPDIKLANGSYVEVKGRFTSANRTRLAAFRASRPDIVLRILLQRDNFLTGKHKARYSDWCVANGIPVSVGETVPEEWTL